MRQEQAESNQQKMGSFSLIKMQGYDIWTIEATEISGGKKNTYSVE